MFLAKWIIFVSSLCAVLLFSGCLPGELSFSPQQAAIQAATQPHGGQNGIVDQSSIQVRQTVGIDRKTFVVVTFTQLVGSRRDRCLVVYATERSSLGTWSPRNGGGGCSGQISGEPAADPPLDAGGGSSSGSGPTDPGYSHTAGMVYQAGIVKVRVTWKDDQAQEVAVINSSYLAVRAGMLGFKKVEGINARDEVVYTRDLQVAPGKQ